MQDLVQFLSNHSYLTTAVIAVFVLVTLVELLRAKRNTSQLRPSEAVQMINRQNAIVIDARSQDQYRKGHIIDAQWITNQELTASNKKLAKYKSKPLIVVCHSGTESQKIAARLMKEGYNACALAGGMRSWYDAQLPVIKE
jgi:rhodanese-related sulfurtransferase